ncbi:response regulator [Clostridium cellulovorans]|uniref:Stage 0 sporulation protein A homolog n=1 Tax=Clostridium cellulovorans (strain ATCC 35296 / DSM 3052 / OCM 3 / 743B) TaxID=573061 RepID=D9SQQ4_CLOC7|nr:response regulator [Clostridium cellulovorans]ADL52260.1 response regulator receiver protein [Clostridium cellulovorans 743B]
MKKILIVDDAAFVRLSLKTLLSNNNFEVIGEACNGVEAVAKYQELKPDLVTMDITMPEMDGIQAVELIKSIDNNAKIIMVSSLGQEDKVMKAVISGASGFIVKPFNDEHIIKTLNSI